MKVGNQFHENFRENDFTKNNNSEQQQAQEDPENLVKSKNEKSFTDLQNHPGCWQKTIEDPENPGLTLQNPNALPSGCWNNGSWMKTIEDPENPGLTYLQNPGLLIQVI